MTQSALDPHTESLLENLFRGTLPSSLTPLAAQSSFSYWRMPMDLYFQTYSMLSKFTTSAYQYAIRIHRSKGILKEWFSVLDFQSLLIQMLLTLYHIRDMSLCKNQMNEAIGKMIKVTSSIIVIIYVSYFSRTTILGDIRRILYPPSIYNRTVFDFDAIVDNTPVHELSNDDSHR